MRLECRNVVKFCYGWAMGAVVGLAGALLSQQVLASGTYPTNVFDIPEGAYKASFIADRNHVTVMSFSGNFDKQLEGGQFNRAARAEN